jgi:hypothetical protein
MFNGCQRFVKRVLQFFEKADNFFGLFVIKRLSLMIDVISSLKKGTSSISADSGICLFYEASV